MWILWHIKLQCLQSKCHIDISHSMDILEYIFRVITTSMKLVALSFLFKTSITWFSIKSFLQYFSISLQIGIKWFGCCIEMSNSLLTIQKVIHLFFALDQNNIEWEQCVSSVLEKFQSETAASFMQFCRKCDQSGFSIDGDEFIKLIMDR